MSQLGFSLFSEFGNEVGEKKLVRELHEAVVAEGEENREQELDDALRLHASILCEQAKEG